VDIGWFWRASPVKRWLIQIQLTDHYNKIADDKKECGHILGGLLIMRFKMSAEATITIPQ